MESKVFNPLTTKKITIGGKIYNELIKSGYVLQNNELVLPEINEEFEENEEFESEENEESEESEEYEYEDEEEEEEEEAVNMYKNYDEEEYYGENENYEYKNLGGDKRPIFYKRDIEIPSYDLPPVRCMTCNKPIAQLHKKYIQLRNEGMDPIEIYKELRLNRPCCRTHITHTPKQYLHDIESSIKEPPIVQSKLSKNPYVDKPQKSILGPNIVRLYEGDEFKGIKKKVTFGDDYVEYKKFTKPEILPKQEIGKGKYYISYSK